MSKTLELSFNGDAGSLKISVRNPKDSLTPVEIKAAMDKLIQANVFESGAGNLVSAAGARMIDRTTQDIVLP
jgi:hypothetical protein